MVRQTDALLRELEKRIEMLEADLKKLRSARDVIRSLEATDEKPIRSKPKTLVAAVARALNEIGPAGSGDIIEWLRENWNADVNPSSTRSTLSGYKGKLFENDGRKWRVMTNVHLASATK